MRQFFFGFKDINFHFVVLSLKKVRNAPIFLVLRSNTPVTPVTHQDFKNHDF